MFLKFIFKIANFSLIFYKFFENLSGVRGAQPPQLPPRGDPPSKPSLGGPHFPPPEKIPAAANVKDITLPLLHQLHITDLF